ncbi:hypothetical protein BU16DRAFT_373836 [Lophium mytilinum]|uniref:Uncharacterized protein n=1 Tax=Lophium mytilinum TaxID=390894 RepID=A0A6A6QV83_9PEZI|nr:hypothetical protein BU16DRAFT_373836 [Lophium mytilinum]
MRKEAGAGSGIGNARQGKNRGLSCGLERAPGDGGNYWGWRMGLWKSEDDSRSRRGRREIEEEQWHAAAKRRAIEVVGRVAAEEMTLKFLSGPAKRVPGRRWERNPTIFAASDLGSTTPKDSSSTLSSACAPVSLRKQSQQRNSRGIAARHSKTRQAVTAHSHTAPQTRAGGRCVAEARAGAVSPTIGLDWEWP